MTTPAMMKTIAKPVPEPEALHSEGVGLHSAVVMHHDDR
jgi:hypothetical protein